jgi:carbonic anhydrase
MKTNRRSFLLSSAAVVAITAAESPALAANEQASMNASDALKALMKGNARFVAGTPACLPATVKRAQLANGQAPFAAVLGCSDSRVPVETVFDHEPGDIFVVRVAGNFADPVGIGSLEYAVAVLKSTLVMVLGHSSCGAVKAATEFVGKGTTFPGHIQGLAAAIAPSAKATQHSAGDWVHNATVANVHANLAKLKADPIIAAKGVEFVGAVYDLASGKVSLV